MVGEAEGRNALDAMRAVKQLEGLSISNDTVVWGWSQGGGAALWTGTVAPRYAPEITLRGVVAFSPSSSLTGLLKSHMGSPGIAVSFASIIDAYTTFYPDVDLETTVPNPKGASSCRNPLGSARPMQRTWQSRSSCLQILAAFRPWKI
jgi:hypothetical protein